MLYCEFEKILVYINSLLEDFAIRFLAINGMITMVTVVMMA